MWANIGDASLGLVTVARQSSEDDPVFIVPEPVGDNRIVGVMLRHKPEGCVGTARFDLMDLTDAPRQNLGGFSIIRLSSRKNGRFNVEGQRSLLRPLSSVEELGESVE